MIKKSKYTILSLVGKDNYGDFMNNLLKAAKWMWSHKGENIYWEHGDFSTSNPDKASPQLTKEEDTAIFKVLEENKLIFAIEHPKKNGNTAYIIHVFKDTEWKIFFRHLTLKYRFFLLPVCHILGGISKFTLWISSVIIAVYLGAHKDFCEKIIKWFFSFF